MLGMIFNCAYKSERVYLEWHRNLASVEIKVTVRLVVLMLVAVEVSVGLFLLLLQQVHGCYCCCCRRGRCGVVTFSQASQLSFYRADERGEKITKTMSSNRPMKSTALVEGGLVKQMGVYSSLP